MNSTHNPQLRSWVESANAPDTDFPIQNLPLGVFQPAGSTPRIGTAIGDVILDVTGCALDGLIDDPACAQISLNELMAAQPHRWSWVRRQLSELLREESSTRPDHLLYDMAECELLLPARIGDYTDFYASVFHASNVGSMFRPGNPLMPNYKWLPVGYHGRASSVVPSGTPVVRPQGQTQQGDAPPGFGPTRQLDYECEAGCFAGTGNQLGRPMTMAQAESSIFGLCLVNDWSARDIQRWEYQPLGPFLAKSFATTISPWIVTREALDPFRVPRFERPPGDPQPLPHLHSEPDAQRGGFDVTLEVWISTQKMRESGLYPVRLSRGNLRDVYWTFSQMLAHHSSNGCNVRPGDLIASGTVSGPDRESRGCLLELAWRGEQPVELSSGEVRRFLEDGDEIALSGFCEREGYRRIGFGSCKGRVEPALVR